jgi:RimJ/RimL family protein N-acetyltransferase
MRRPPTVDYLSAHNVVLRARQPEDVPVLQAQLYNDLAARSRADTRPWRPIPPDPAFSPCPVGAPDDDADPFSVLAVADAELAGEAVLWGTDLHNRLAHVGLALLPGFRGRGWGVEVLRLLCCYGFAVRGLNRLQLETGAGNTPMLRAAASAGFRKEGVLGQAAWALGSWRHGRDGPARRRLARPVRRVDLRPGLGQLRHPAFGRC